MMCWYRTPRDTENEGRHGKPQRPLGFTLSSEGVGRKYPGNEDWEGSFVHKFWPFYQSNKLNTSTFKLQEHAVFHRQKKNGWFSLIDTFQAQGYLLSRDRNHPFKLRASSLVRVWVRCTLTSAENSLADDPGAGMFVSLDGLPQILVVPMMSL